MESKLKSFKDTLTLQDCEKTNLTTPFSINDILTKENEAKCDFENGTFCSDFGGKMNFLSKAGCYSKDDGFSVKKEALEKGLKYYDDCNGCREYSDDGVLDMSRKNNYSVTELSGKFHDVYTFLLMENLSTHSGKIQNCIKKF